MSIHIVTYAQNATPVHEAFWRSIEVFAETNGAQIHVLLGRYKNPTSHWSRSAQTEEWWDPRAMKYGVGRWVEARRHGKLVKGPQGETVKRFVPGRRRLCKNLRLLGDISIQPTASRPLSGLEVFAGECSAIFGHPKRALDVVPTSTRTPRVMWSTSACTLPNYTTSKAGKRGAAHHVLGAVVVEVEDKTGLFWVRHVTADKKTGAFTDLGTTYTPEGPREAASALALTLGDYHAGREDEAVLGASERLCALTRPKTAVLHDLLDFKSRSHHARDMRNSYARRALTVRDEVQAAVRATMRVAAWEGVGRVVVVRSNHDEHLERWLEECRPKEDPQNAPYYHELWSRTFEAYHREGEFPDVFAAEAARLIPKDAGDIRFLKRNESLRIGGVENGFHGDRGANGSRASDLGYTRLGVRITKGHSHVPAIIDNVFSTGVTAKLDHGYNLLPSSWMNAHVIQYADGKRAVILVIDGRFSLGDSV